MSTARKPEITDFYTRRLGDKLDPQPSIGSTVTFAETPENLGHIIAIGTDIVVVVMVMPDADGYIRPVIINNVDLEFQDIDDNEDQTWHVPKRNPSYYDKVTFNGIIDSDPYDGDYTNEEQRKLLTTVQLHVGRIVENYHCPEDRRDISFSCDENWTYLVPIKHLVPDGPNAWTLTQKGYEQRWAEVG